MQCYISVLLVILVLVTVIFDIFQSVLVNS